MGEEVNMGTGRRIVEDAPAREESLLLILCFLCRTQGAATRCHLGIRGSGRFVAAGHDHFAGADHLFEVEFAQQ